METKQRHGVLTAYIILGVITNIPTLYFIVSDALTKGTENMIPMIQSILIVLQIIFFIAIYNWKKWGLYGLITTSLGYFVIALYMGRNPLISILWGLLFYAILFVVLSLQKGQKSGWANLE